jgi:ectoine hydroxylase-related dioxygenase (phytanoyl-CoA dioxygenase family)
MAGIFRDNDLNRRFIDDGYVVVPFLDAEEVADLRRFFEDRHPDKFSAFYASAMREDAEYRQAICNAIRAICDPKTAAILDGWKVCIASFLAKETGETREFAMHVDPSFADESVFMPALQIWCPLGNVSTANGCLQVVPGSQHHTFPLRPISPQGTVGHPFDGVMALLKANYARTIEMTAGEAIIFNSKLLHGSGPNMSAERRVAIQCLMVPQDAPILHSVMVSPTQAEVFEVDEAFFWRHQIGTYPAGAKSLGVVEHKFVPFHEADVLQSPHLRRASAPSRNWRRWIGF